MAPTGSNPIGIKTTTTSTSTTTNARNRRNVRAILPPAANAGASLHHTVPVDTTLLGELDTLALRAAHDGSEFASTIAHDTAAAAHATIRAADTLARAARQLAVQSADAALDLRALVASADVVLSEDGPRTQLLTRDLELISSCLDSLEDTLLAA